jgi:hypothetical protein
MRDAWQRIAAVCFLTAAATVLGFGCQSAYYNTMERFGYQKREILVDRVQDARDEQAEAKEQFKSALQQFSELVNFDGGELEEKYEKLDAAFERCKDKAAAVQKRISSVQDVGEALFAEWQTELKQYSNAGLREASRKKMVETRRQYDRLVRSMKKAESKIDPVLAAFRDQVLFLKHNLNARAVASLQTELGIVESDVAALIREMEAAIAEADGFIRTMSE